MNIRNTLEATRDVLTKPSDGLSTDTGRFQARLLSALLLVAIPFPLVSMLVAVNLQGHVQPGMPVTATMLIIAYGLSRTRAYVSAASLTIAAPAVTSLAAILSATEYSRSVAAMNLMWLVLPLLLAGLLLTVREAGLVALVVMATVASLPALIPSLSLAHVVPLLGFFGIVSLLILLATRTHRRYVDEVHRQVARQKRVEGELLRLKEFNENMIKNMAEGIVVQDGDGRFSFVNPAAATMLGYKADEMVGMHWKAVIPSNYHQKVETVDRRRTEGETSRYEVELLRKDGTRLPVMVSGSPRQDADGAFRGTLAVFTNISERKRAEEKLRRLNEELEERVSRRTAELVAANERLEELDRLKTKFIADISHELRTPTMNLRLYLALLREGDPAKRERHLDTLEEEVERLSTIVENIFDVSYLDKGQDEVPLDPIDLNALVQSVAGKFRPHVEHAGMEMSVSLAEKLPLVLGVRNQIAQAIGHLVENALKYTSEGEIILRTESDAAEQRAGVVVRDTGMGVPDEEVPHLFSRFYRSRRVGQSTIPGAGLGLAVVKEIVSLHGGEVTVQSREGEGSTFTMWFPAAPAP